MRVLQYLDSLNRGGAEMQALDVCRNAARFGIEVTAVAAGGGPLEDEFRDAGFEFIRLSRKLPLDLYVAAQLRRLIREREIRIVHGYQPVDGLHLYLATRGLPGVKRVLSFQGFIQDTKNRVTARFLIPRMDANISVSRGLTKWLKEIDQLDVGEHFTEIYNGADPDRLKPSGHSLKTELGLQPDDLLFGMIANFYRDPRKDQMTVCRALPLVFKEIPNSHCVFVGRIEEGAEEKMVDCLNFCIEQKIIGHVHFVEARSDVPDILKDLDIFVLSSLHEGLPVAVSEAMLAGVPMIVSEIDPLLEATRNGELAETFPVRDAERLAIRLASLLADSPARKELAEKARLFAVEHFSIDAHLHRLRKLYSSLSNAEESAT